MLWKKIYKKLKARKTKKGSFPLTEAIMMLILLIPVCACLDILLISTQTATLNNMGKELARTISVQGGALNTKPQGYPNNYYTISQLGSFMQDSMTAAGYKDGDWYVTVTYTREYLPDGAGGYHSVDSTREQKIIGFNSGALATSETSRIDYLSSFTVTIVARNKWRFLSALLPLESGHIQVPLPGTSEWKWNFDAWESEY